MSVIPSEFTQDTFRPLFRFWEQLSPFEKTQLLDQIRNIDLSLLHIQKQIITQPPEIPKEFEPLTDVFSAGQADYYQQGLKRLKEGQVGCVVMAGGQGSRLRFEGPKGAYPVSVIKRKSLFQLCAEKVLAASHLAGRPLPLAIMTSPLNEEQTKHFFQEAGFFGLEPQQVSFFSQSMLPLLDKNGNLFLETPSQLAEGPDGNGSLLKSFMASDTGERWMQRGIQYVNVILIDNPLALPFDIELLGFQAKKQIDIAIKCTEKMKPDEKVGVLVKERSCIRVVEYSEMDAEDKTAIDDQGHLKYRLANLSLFSFSMSFIKKLYDQKVQLPLHKAWKAAKFVNDQGKVQLPLYSNAWKFEAFIFDVLAYTDRVAALLYPRQGVFAPLKNLIGSDSLETVQKALQTHERQIIEKLTGIAVDEGPLELSAEFYYPSQEMIQRWKGKVVKPGYLEGSYL